MGRLARIGGEQNIAVLIRSNMACERSLASSCKAEQAKHLRSTSIGNPIGDGAQRAILFG
jgi:hypothetical protein